MCINYDKQWFAKQKLAVPTSLDDLTKPAYKGLLVVENPATSSPGLAFLLATIARYGDGGWRDYWSKLRANDVKIVDGWENAYDGDFTRRRTTAAYPLVVSYASSPPAAVYFAKPQPKTSPVGTMLDRCFRQVEFAGVLKGTEHAAAARKLVDFMLSARFQADVPLQMFVFPVRDGTPLPPVFAKFAEVAKDPLSLPARRSAATATSGSSSGPTPCSGSARRAAARRDARWLALGPARVPRGLLRLPGRRDRRPRALAPDGTLDLDPLRDVVTDPGAPARDLVHGVAGRAVDGAHAGDRAARRVRARAVRLSRAARRARARHRAVRAADGRGRHRVRRAARPGGPLARLGLDQTVWAILLAHVFFNYAVVVRTVGGLWSHLDPHQEEAARMLGAGRWRAFREVTLPALRPAIAAAASIVFLFTFTSFGVILILGGPRYATLETEIYRQTAELLNLPLAAALTIVQLVAVVVLLAVTARIQGRERSALRLRAAAETARRPRTARERLVVGANLAVMALLLGGPIAVLVERSLHTPTGYGLRLLPRARRAPSRQHALRLAARGDRHSLRYAVLATVIAVVVGGCGAVALARTRGAFTRRGSCRSRSACRR